ncbi:MAG: PSP1 domain-containing protein [Armatimonadota bacterium]
MPIVVGISLRTAGKIYYFDPGEIEYHQGERVLVETSRGPELGTVKLTPHEVSDAQIVPPLKCVVRRATAADITRDALNREREDKALEACKRHIDRLKLPMRLIDAEYNFDGSHVLVHFLADNRVDFRELVRDVARDLHTRIELRQVGVRDEAKLLGGCGVCGRPLCCSAFLTNFTPVAINMAKVQGLALNPTKISGSCGRLMCCLAFEYDHYKGLHSNLPRLNAQVETTQGRGKVTKVNVLARQVEVTIPEQPSPIWLPVDDVHVVPRGGNGCCGTEGPCPKAQAMAAEVTQQVDEASPEESPDATEESLVETNPVDPAAPAERTGRNRRRRHRKPAGSEQQAPEAPHNTASESSGANADASSSPRKRPRRRSRKGRGAQPAAGGDGPAQPVRVPAGPAPAGSQMPSGRYHPRGQQR